MSYLQSLIAYQAEDRKIWAIEKELAGTEERKKYVQARKFLKTAQPMLDGYDAKAATLASELSGLEGLYEKNVELLKEFDEIDFGELENEEGELAYLKKKALALADTLKSLKRDLSSVKEKMEKVTAEYADLKAKCLSAQKQYKKYKEAYETIAAGKEGEIQAIRAAMADIAKDIPADILERYQGKRKEGVWPVLSSLKDRSCLMCGMELPPAEISKITVSGVIECEHCHRLLYKE